MIIFHKLKWTKFSPGKLLNFQFFSNPPNLLINKTRKFYLKQIKQENLLWWPPLDVSNGGYVYLFPVWCLPSSDTYPLGVPAPPSRRRDLRPEITFPHNGSGTKVTYPWTDAHLKTLSSRNFIGGEQWLTMMCLFKSHPQRGFAQCRLTGSQSLSSDGDTTRRSLLIWLFWIQNWPLFFEFLYFFIREVKTN